MLRGSPSAWSSNINGSSIFAGPKTPDRRGPRVPRGRARRATRGSPSHANNVKSMIAKLDREPRSTYSTIPSSNNRSHNQNSPLGRSATHGRKMRGDDMLDIDWRSAAAYQHAKVIPASGFAWEYLRRDDDYHRDFERVSRRKSPAATALEAFSQRWGLRFPTQPAGAC